MHLPISISEYTKLVVTSGQEGLRAILDSIDYGAIDLWIHSDYEWLWSCNVIHSLEANDEEGSVIHYVLGDHYNWYTRRTESPETYNFLLGKLNDNT